MNQVTHIIHFLHTPVIDFFCAICYSNLRKRWYGKRFYGCKV